MSTMTSIERKGKAANGRTPLLDETYIHLTSARHSTKSLAAALGVSTATAFRLVQALRRRGVVVESMKQGRQWYFEVRDEPRIESKWRSDPLVRKAGFIRGCARPAGQSVDEVVYGQR
jgi:biotin operon repressor